MNSHSGKLKAMLRGLHHVTALAGDPQQNLDFYTQSLRLRLIKRTVNFDDPATHHFYYAPAPVPGAIATFFPWPTAPAGREGSGQAAGLCFAIPANALAWWADRMHAARNVRFDRCVLSFRDPAGLPIDLIADQPESSNAAIVRLHSAALCVADAAASARFLTEVLGFQFVGREFERERFQAGDALLDLVSTPAERAKLSAGMVHHIAWRVSSEAEQNEIREKVKAAGVRTTRVIDRKYFRCIYFREPGGVLFEIATEQPGFTIDEPADRLGCALQLPPWLESSRESIERRLAPVNVPCAV